MNITRIYNIHSISITLYNRYFWHIFILSSLQTVVSAFALWTPSTITDGNLIKAQNPVPSAFNGNPPTLLFTKPGHSSLECNNPNAVIALRPGQVMSTNDMQTLFGSSTQITRCFQCMCIWSYWANNIFLCIARHYLYTPLTNTRPKVNEIQGLCPFHSWISFTHESHYR